MNLTAGNYEHDYLALSGRLSVYIPTPRAAALTRLCPGLLCAELSARKMYKLQGAHTRVRPTLLKHFMPGVELFQRSPAEFSHFPPYRFDRSFFFRFCFREKTVRKTDQLFLNADRHEIDMRQRQALRRDFFLRQTGAGVPLANQRVTRQSLVSHYFSADNSMT